MLANHTCFRLLSLSLYFKQTIVQFNIYAPEEFLFNGIFRRQIEPDESANVESSTVDSEQTLEIENAVECSIPPSNTVSEVSIIIIL